MWSEAALGKKRVEAATRDGDTGFVAAETRGDAQLTARSAPGPGTSNIYAV